MSVLWWNEVVYDCLFWSSMFLAMFLPCNGTGKRVTAIVVKLQDRSAIFWDHSNKFARWQHLQWSAGRGLLCLAALLLFIVTVTYFSISVYCITLFLIIKCGRLGRNDASGEDISNSWNAKRPRIAGWSWWIWQTVLDKTSVKHCRFQVLSSPANEVHIRKLCNYLCQR